MFTEIKNDKKIVCKKVSVENDMDAILKEFNFINVADCKWELSHFTISLSFFGEDKIPHIYLYYKEEFIDHYYTFFHRMWWYSTVQKRQINTDESVINVLMQQVRDRWLSCLVK